MSAYCFTLTSLTLLLSTTFFHGLTAMEAESRPLIRTLSIMPLANPFWQAVEQNDQQRTAELIPGHFPNALDCQYALYKAANSEEMRRLILQTIEEFWFAKIEPFPESGLKHYLCNYLQLISKNSFPQGIIERPFMRMLSRIRERIMGVKEFVQLEKLLQLARRMPYEGDPETLKEISGRSVAREIYDQGLNLDDELENIPLDVRELVMGYYKELQDEQTMTFKGLL